MPTKTAAPWEILYAIATDEIKAFPAEVDQVKAERIAKIFGERLSIYKAYAGPATLKTGEWADQTKNAEVFTMPAVGTANQSIVTSSSVAEAKLTTGAKFVGGGLSSSTAILTTGMVAVWQSDGTNWRLVAGEVKREGVWINKSFSKAEAEAGVEPSASRVASVGIATSVGGVPPGLTIGGVASSVFEHSIGPWTVPAGQKWKCTEGVSTVTLLL